MNHEMGAPKQTAERSRVSENQENRERAHRLMQVGIDARHDSAMLTKALIDQDRKDEVDALREKLVRARQDFLTESVVFLEGLEKVHPDIVGTQLIQIRAIAAFMTSSLKTLGGDEMLPPDWEKASYRGAYGEKELRDLIRLNELALRANHPDLKKNPKLFGDELTREIAKFEIENRHLSIKVEARNALNELLTAAKDRHLEPGIISSLQSAMKFAIADPESKKEEETD